jgi:hypothetical protein
MPQDIIVEVLRFCHPLIVQGKCHHGESDIEPEGTEPVKGIERSEFETDDVFLDRGNPDL